MDKYKDIINLEYPVASTRKRMSRLNRAAQFSPFSALTGYEEAVKETARFTNQQAELDEYHIALVNQKITAAFEKKSENPMICITFFQPDLRKKGGEYKTVTGILKGIDEINHTLILKDGTNIPICSIYDIDTDVL